MKKLLFVLAAAVLTAAMPLYAYAEEAPADPPAEQETAAETRPEDMFTYTVNVAGRAEITDFTVSDTYTGELVIPSQLDGHDVGYLDNAAFMNAKGLTSVTIPATVSDIGNSVFFGCENLEKIHVEAGNPYLAEIDDGVLVADNNQFLVAYPAARAGENYPIPASVDEIAPGCFGFAKNLKEITIPEKVQYIDKWAFAYSKLEKVNISSMQIDDYAFAYCDNLHEVILNPGLESIYDAAFSVCPALTEINLPDTLTYIGQAAFSGTGLTSVTIPASVDEIDYCAFGYDRDLHTVGGFVIYGQSGSEAEYYATAVDPDNDYENNFTFIATDLTETQPETSAETPETAVITETNAEGEVITEQITIPPEETTEAGMTGILGAELKNNNFLQIVLATAGGIAVVLALTLIILSVRKPKKNDSDQEDEK
ncbi:MAG: leucine-rich repeat domain-containing protein [Oscillospiraceae bacterium]|nr:leucine-rich repeat domain-containing protein [Oscillospiraceae bacterium]